jgi:uncharacterized membrane protein YfcA
MIRPVILLALFLLFGVATGASLPPNTTDPTASPGGNLVPFPEHEGRMCTTALDCARGEVCSARTMRCSDCGSSSQCKAREECVLHADGRSLCAIQPLFKHFDRRVMIATFLVFCGGIFAATGGIGGGGLFVPIFVFALEIGSHQAIPMSKAAVLGGAMGNFALNVFATHPHSKKRPLIDFDVTLALEPMTLLGTVVGVVLNVLMSDVALVTSLAMLLALLATRSFQKAIAAYKLETEQFKYSSLSREQAAGSSGPAVGPSSSAPRPAPHTSSVVRASRRDGDDNDDNGNNNIDDENDDERRAMLGADEDGKAARKAALLARIIQDEDRFPWGKCMAMVLCWAVLLVLTLLKGGHGAPSVIGVKPCSGTYFALYASVFPVAIIFTIAVGFHLRRQARLKDAAGYHYLEGDVVWTNRNAFLFPALSFFSGVAAGMLGIGGGMIKGPMLVEMGILPKVMSATASYMILFTASATVTQFSILGLLPLDYGLFWTTLVFVSSLVGQKGINYFVKRTGRNSLVIFCIASLISIATVLLVLAMTMHMKHTDVNTGTAIPWSIKKICSA